MKAKKLYFCTLTLSLFSLAISVGWITFLLRNNPYLAIDPAQNVAQLEIFSSQKVLLQLASLLPNLVFALNLVLAVVVYRGSQARKERSFRLTALWIVISLAYQLLLYSGYATGLSIDWLTLPLMAACWLSKAGTCLILFRENRAEKTAPKGVLCAN